MMVGGSTAGSSGKVQLNYWMYNMSIDLDRAYNVEYHTLSFCLHCLFLFV